MKVMVDGKEIELVDELEKGSIELDKLTNDNPIDLEDTIEVTEEVLKRIQEMDKEKYE